MTIEVGSKIKGKVTTITKFGAFIELPEGKTGLVHISEVANSYVSDINEHLTVGDEVEVKILNIESNGKISLSIKKAIDKPPARNFRTQPSHRGSSSRGNMTQGNQGLESFDQKMSRFLKDSEERLVSLKRNTEHKRGGRGGRRR